MQENNEFESHFVSVEISWSKEYSLAGENPGLSSAAGTGTSVIKIQGSRGSLLYRLSYFWVLGNGRSFDN